MDPDTPLLVTFPVWSPKQCASVIRRAETLGFEDAPINTLDGPVRVEEVRNNRRVMFDDPEMAADLYAQVRPRLPERIERMSLTGINERFRVYRYERGQYFAPHRDGFWSPGPGRRSVLTLMVYLNEDFQGGSTAFHELWKSVRPRTGMGIFFLHQLLHEGAPVISGVKYALRTDVMYTRTPTPG